MKDFQLDADGNIDLSKYDADNPLNLEQTLTVPEQVKAFNDNVFGGAEANNDFHYNINVQKAHLDAVRESKGTWWGNLDQLFRYSMQNAIDLGYLPFKVELVGETEEFYNFSLLCEDRRIERDTKCTGSNNCSGLGMP